MHPIKNTMISGKMAFVCVVIFCATSVFTIAGSQISLGLALAFWLIHIIDTRNKQIFQSGLEIQIAVFIAICLLSSAFSVRPTESFYNLRSVLLVCIIYVFSGALTTERRLFLAVDILLIFATLFSIVGIVLFVLSITEKSMATHSTSMTWGALSVFFMAMTIAQALFGVSRNRRILYSFALIPQAFNLMFSYVRGSYIGVLIAAVLLFWFKSKRLVFILFICLLIFGLILPSSPRRRALSIFDLNVPSTRVRINQWRDSIDMFLDRPILGFGWVDLGEIHRSYAPPDADLSTDEYTIGHFHNNFVMILMNFGILGLGSFLWLVFRVFQIEFQVLKRVGSSAFYAIVLGSVGGLVGFLANGMFDWLFGDAEVATMLWISVGFVLSARIISRNQINAVG